MTEIEGYQFHRVLKSWNSAVSLYLAQNEEGKQVQILQVRAEQDQKSRFERIRKAALEWYKQVPDVFPEHIQSGWEEESNTLFFIWHISDETSAYLTQGDLTLKSRIPGKAWLRLMEALEQARKQNLQGLYLTPDTVQWTGTSLHLHLAVLGEFWQRLGVREEKYISPEARASNRLMIKDDIWALAHLMQALIPGGDKISELQASGADEPENRPLDWKTFREQISPVLARMDERQVMPESKPQTRIQVKFNKEVMDYHTFLEDLNQDASMSISSEKSKNGSYMGFLYSEKYRAGWFLEGNTLRIPKYEEQNDRHIKNKSNLFPVTFQFVQNIDSSISLENFIAKTASVQNVLNETAKQKTQTLDTWKKLPETEKEYIEETAFSASYTQWSVSPNDHNVFIFTLKKDNTILWSRLRELKKEKTCLKIQGKDIGFISDWDQKKYLLTLRDCKILIDEIDDAGELTEDVKMEISQFKKQVEACDNFSKGSITNPDLVSYLAKPDEMPIPAYIDTDPNNFLPKILNEKMKTDEMQCEAVYCALHRKPLFLIQGPPGTGKTTVIVEMIRQIVRQNPEARILVTSQSNLAVDNVLERLPEAILSIRLAATEDRIGEKLKSHSFETRLSTWVMHSKTKSLDHINQKHEKTNDTKVLKLYQQYLNIRQETDFYSAFQNLLNVPNLPKYYRENTFKDCKTQAQVEKKFRKELGEEVLKKLEIRGEWEAFLNNAESSHNNPVAQIMSGNQLIDLKTALMQSVNVIGATCIHIASSKYSKVDFRFDYVIMDESSKATPPEALVALNMGKNIILIGDHKQLPPVVTREDAVKEKLKDKLDDQGLDVNKTFGVSLFEHLMKTIEKEEKYQPYCRMLDIQYRMPSQIGSLISRYFYEGKLKNPDPMTVPGFEASKAHDLPLKKATSMFFFSTSEDENRYDNGNKFKRNNSCNVRKIQELLAWLNQAYPENLKRTNEKGEPAPLTIGIIAGYRGQVGLLQQEIKLDKYPNFLVTKIDEKGKETTESLIRINTVDKFQGAEEDIIIYDIVKSNRSEDTIGFLDDYRRINVAFSRVKRLLVVVGDHEYILKRAKLHPGSQFKEFKLQQITQEFQNQNLIIHNIQDIYEPQNIKSA